MRAKLLTLAALAAMLVGGMLMPSSADARPWRGYYGYGPYYGSYYYGRPAVGYYGAYPAYGYGYYPYRSYNYGYYNYPYRTYYGPGYYNPGGGVYIGARPGVYLRF